MTTMSSPEPETEVTIVKNEETGAIVVVWGFRYEEDEMENVIYKIYSLQQQEQEAIEGASEGGSLGERCCEFCFARVSRKGLRPTSTTVLQKRSLRESRNEGWGRLRSGVFPLFSRCAREVWTYLQLLIALAILLYSSITFAVTDKDERTIVDIIFLAFSIPSCLLSLLDVIITIYFQRCRLCRDCAHRTCTAVDESIDNESDEQTDQDEGCCDQCCKLCCKNKYADLARLLLSEVFIYPVVICAIFQFILAIIRIDNEINLKEGIKIVVFGVGILWKIVFVYVIRLVVLIRTIQAIQRERHEDGFGRKAGMWFQIRFLLHVIGQMVSQVIMITSVGVKMYLENGNFILNDNSTMNFTLDNTSAYDYDSMYGYESNFTLDMNFTLDNSIHVSSYLWYMIVGAYIIPLAGIFTFAISNYYYLQQYPIGLFLDFLLKRSEDKIAKDTLEIVESDYIDMRNTSFFVKYRYVFYSPTLAMLCLMYSALLVAFAVCCFANLKPVSSDNPIAEVMVLGINVSINWKILFWVGVVLINIINIGVVLVAAVWSVIIAITILLIVLYLLVCLLSCFTDEQK